MGLRPLGRVREIVQAAGMDVSYVYDDLVFVDHNGFLLEFAGTDDELIVHVNEQAVRAELEDALARLQSEAREREMHFREGTLYRLSQGENETLLLEFVPGP